MTAFVVYDVFTETAFGGNQLAVIPDATGLPEEHLQKIAREFNFSETTFVYPPDNPAHTAKVRIFTPTMEVPFAGHPTIGTTVALHQLGRPADMVLELGVGPIPCAITDGVAAFTTAAPLETFAEVAPDFAARCLSLPPSTIATDVHLPIQASLGLPFVFVQLKDRAALEACTYDIGSFREGAELYPTPLDFAVYAYTITGDQVEARMFAPLDDIPEDPATGSAAATLTALLSQRAGRPLALRITQGEAMGRPSTILTSAKPGDPMPITVKGKAVQTMQGTLTL